MFEGGKSSGNELPHTIGIEPAGESKFRVLVEGGLDDEILSLEDENARIKGSGEKGGTKTPGYVLSGEARKRLFAAAVIGVSLLSAKPVMAKEGLNPEEPSLEWRVPSIEAPDEPLSIWEIYKRPETNPYSDMIIEIFGDNAENMEQILRWGTPGAGKAHGIDYGGENLSFDPNAVNYNRNGSVDRGLFMINSNTFANYMRKMSDELDKLGIKSFDDMFDPRKNALMARIILENQGYGAWYGRPKHLSYRWVVHETPEIEAFEESSTDMSKFRLE